MVELATLLETWIAQGRPEQLFTIGVSVPQGKSFVLTEATGKGLTNIGDCIPERPLVFTNTTQMRDRDAFFAAATELPDSLADTDLYTLEGEALARDGVIAYAPTYTLWSDGSGKLRHVRVPMGQSIAFDKAAQRFRMPPNTRFYKTFFKKVIDSDGNESHRKIETRLIVARPDAIAANGTAQFKALFGTYVWNEDETEARLLRDPLRNGQPFRDRLITYATDEPKVKAILDSKPSNLSFALEDENPGLLRHYAIPGSGRCIDCHMGSTTENFVLGFTPLQVWRRPLGQGGVYEAPAADELDQLDRLIAYGVISGIKSAAEIVPLERSQGERKPRNEQELTAQAYVYGNCSHCHNPRGLPSVKSPELKDALNFFPSATGGVFEFPLDRTSPLRKRGIDQDLPMPYITPSLREYPQNQALSKENFTPKWIDCGAGPHTLCGDSVYGVTHIDAPWRSLIYRNVETPFTYADDFVIFPRMPMHSSGFDCRAPRILGEWMVSIPALRKRANISEDAVRSTNPTDMTVVDDDPQPYAEVRADDPRYPEALENVAYRLRRYRASPRYANCPDDRDIVDLKVLRGERLTPPAGDTFDPKDPTKIIVPGTGAPTHTHWVTTDVTDPPGDWYPRRPDWDEVLVRGTIDPKLAAAERQQLKDVTEALATVKIDAAVRDLALTPKPFGLWQAKPGCNFTGVPTAGSFTGTERPRWFDVANPADDAPIYMQAPGAAVYSTICLNCHGPAADSGGLLAEAIMTMTGGDARVANFRDGLFGPAAMPGANRARVFAPTPTTGMAALSPDDWGSRYMAWMALGGTQRKLPASILNIVSVTRVIGAQRATNRISVQGTPNMLKLAQDLCAHVLLADKSVDGRLGPTFYTKGSFNWGVQTGLIASNYDAEMWLRLCSLNNRKVVRVPFVASWTDHVNNGKDLILVPEKSLFWGDSYPADRKVLDHTGAAQNGITPDNLFPMCIEEPANAADRKLAEDWLSQHPVRGTVIPFCPPSVTDPKNRLQSVQDSETRAWTWVDANKWAVRGAINAGLAVFVYLDELERGRISAQPTFNHCEERK